MKKGFTLIELLVVVSIIGILATVGLFFSNNAQAKARDAKRKQDIAAIKVALNLYYQDNGSYPVIPGFCCEDPSTASNTLKTALVPKYLKEIPQPPKYDPTVYHSRYSYDNCCPQGRDFTYRLYGWLENSKDPEGIPAEGTYLYMTLPPD